MTRVRLALATLLACALAAAIGLILASGGSGKDKLQVSANGFAGAVRPPGIPPRDFALRDQDGDRVALRADRGKVVVLTFLYTHCQDTCPITAQQIRGALDDLGHDVPAIAVSVDPPNDTPASAKRFLLEQHLTGRMDFLMGTKAQLAPVWKAYGIQPQVKGIDHSAYVILVDKKGVQRVGFPTDQLTPEGLAHDIRRLAAEA